MNSKQLQCIIKHDRVMSELVSGVYPYDRLPRYINKVPQGFVANTDSHDRPGQHWVALYTTEKSYGEFFCSFGNSISHYSPHFIDFFRQRGVKTVISNTRKLQSDNSMFCRFYTVYYLAHRCRDISLQQIIDTFDDSDTYVNDEFVHDNIVNSFEYCF